MNHIYYHIKHSVDIFFHNPNDMQSTAQFAYITLFAQCCTAADSKYRLATEWNLQTTTLCHL